MKKKLQYIISLFAILLVIPFIMSKILPYEDVNDQYHIRGQYNEALLEINSLDRFVSRMENISKEDPENWVDTLDSLLRYRFYHGTCRYNFNENWLAYSLGLIFWDDLRMIVKADDILQKKVAVCNQVNIVFQAVLKEYGFTYRSVGLNHHMATEVFYNNAWHYYDADYEPTLEERISAKALINDKVLFEKVYSETEGASFNPHFDEILSTKTLTYSKENQVLASKLKVFHSLSYFISEYGWMVLLLLTVFTKYL